MSEHQTPGMRTLTPEEKLLHVIFGREPQGAVETRSPEELAAVKERLRGRIESVLVTLTPREREILEQRYGLKDGQTKSLQEVATDLQLTKGEVHEEEVSAVEKLQRGKQE